MKLDFSYKQMDVGTASFNFIRTLMVSTTGGAELNECLRVGARIRDGDAESWVREWASMAQQLQRYATGAADKGQFVTARQGWLRASNYYRSALFSLPHSDARLDTYLTASRQCFHEAAKLSSPCIELIDIPFEARGCRRTSWRRVGAGGPRCSPSTAATPPTRKWFIGSASRRWREAGTTWSLRGLGSGAPCS